MFLRSSKRLFSFAVLSIALASCGGSTPGITLPAGSVQPLSTAQNSFVTGADNIAAYRGCPVFTSGDYYNRQISYGPLDAHSLEYITGIVKAGDGAGFYASTGVEKVNLADGRTPMVEVQPQVSYHPFPVDYPWTASFYIEHYSDRHSIVISTQNCHLYEAYHTEYAGHLSAYSGANWDLSKPFVPLPPGTPSAMSSGLSLFAGMVKWEDYQSGAIRHALNWAPPQGTVAAWKFVRPASDTTGGDFRGVTRYQLPFGARLRLRKSFSTAGFGPQARMVAEAMKTYGVFLSDTGSADNALYFANAADGSNPWNGGDLSALSRIHISDFEVLALPPAQSIPGH